MKLSKKIPDDGAIKEALMHHNGWVYEIDPGFNREDEIPPQSIVGAWKVDENGKITDLKECSKFETEQNLVGYKFKHVREFPVF
jgi:hypothetical protein